MAEEVAAQPDVAEAQAETSSEPIKYDESLLIIVKGKVQAPKQPDHAEAQILIKKLQAEISKRADRIKEIKGIEENLRGKAQGVAAGNPEVIKKLQGLRNDRGAILRTKAATREELRSTDATREALRAEMRSIRDKSRNVNPDKLEEEISQLEYRVQHESLSEQEEKKVHQQIQNLTAARPLARKFQEYDARLKETEAQRGAIVKRLQELDAQVKVLDDAIAEQNAILDEAKAKADQHKEDLPALQVEKKENYEICVALRAKIDELRKKNDEEYQDFIKRDRAFKAYQREQRRLKYLERVKEREARDKERAEMTQAAAAEAGVEPFQAEVLTCDHMLGYLRGLAGVKEEEAKQEEKKIEVPAGLKPLKREEQLDDIFKGLGKKAKPQKGKAAPAPAAKASESKPKVTKLNFTLETLKTFMALGVDVPQTSDQLLATIDKVEAKKASYLERRAKAKEAGANGHARVVEEEPAPSTSAAAADEEPAAAAEADEPAPAAVEEEEEEEEEAPAPAPAADKPTAEEPAAAAEKPAPAAASATPAKVQEEQAEEEADSEPVSPAPAADAAAEEAANGLGVKLKVSGETVSLSITA